MRKLLCLLSLFAVTIAVAAVRPGQNIIINSDLSDKDLLGQPVYWYPGAIRHLCHIRNEAGPQKQTTCLFSSEKPIAGEVNFRQEGLRLVSGETYKVSALVRTKNFKSPHYGVSIATNGWKGEIGLTKEIKPNQDWTRLEADVVLPKSDGNIYFAVFFAVGFSGEIEMTDFRLTAVSEGALKGTTPPVLEMIRETPNLVPMAPLLRQIPMDNPVISFRFFGRVKSGDIKDYDVILTASDSQNSAKAALSAEEFSIKLPADFKRGELTAKIINRKDGQLLFTRGYDYGVVDIPKVTASGHKRLNNLVVELLNAKVEQPTQNFEFATVRHGWVFIAAQNTAKDNLEVVLDGSKTIIKADTPRHETFRELPIGRHTLTVKNASQGAVMVARSIPVLLNYCPGVNSGVGENPPFDWDFQMKYVLPAVTTQNGGSIPPEKRNWFHGQGYHWLGNCITRDLNDETDLARRLQKDGAMRSPVQDGVTCDEQGYNQTTLISYYASGLHAFRDKTDRLVYTWTGGRPSTPSLDHDFISACINVSGGRGLILHEVYFATRETEQEARDYVLKTLKTQYKAYNQFFPIAKRNVGFILGDFNQIPILSLAHYPESDLKYFLDMQLNILANDPDFKDLPCTGYWGSYYTDHEFHRWAFMLLRHYCIDGKTDMLSANYDMAYNPKTVLNGDFRETLKPWTINGNVTMDQFTGFAFSSQNRYHSAAGDTFAVFSKIDNETSTISQKVGNLVPGKTYCLQFATFDRDDVKAKRLNPRQFGITATISGNPEIRKDLSWIHVDSRKNGRYGINNGVARINLQHIVFVAPSREVTVTFDNAKALKGENLGLNCVSLNRFILEEESQAVYQQNR